MPYLNLRRVEARQPNPRSRSTDNLAASSDPTVSAATQIIDDTTAIADAWTRTHMQRGGWIKGITLWPIGPNEEDLKGAGEFASRSCEVQKICVEKFTCPGVRRGCGEKPWKEKLYYATL